MSDDLFNKILNCPDELNEAEHKELKKNIRPVMRRLIELENLTAIRKVSEYKYYGVVELESFIIHAREKERKLALLWLLNEKRKKFGFEDRSFEF